MTDSCSTHGEQGVFRYSAELSFNPKTPNGKTRYFEIESFQIREGHYAEWEEAVKMVKDAYAKSVPDANWMTYYQVLGPEGHYIMFMPLESLKEIDTMFGLGQEVRRDSRPRRHEEAGSARRCRHRAH